MNTKNEVKYLDKRLDYLSIIWLRLLIIPEYFTIISYYLVIILIIIILLIKSIFF